MTPERKRKATELLESVAVRITIIDEMIAGKRPSDQADAKRYIKEIKNGIDKVNEMISIF